MARSRNSFKGKRVLVTGGLGFIGSNLAHRLVALHADVCLLDNLHPECGANWANVEGIRDCVRVETIDQADTANLAWLVDGQDYIFNLAGNISHVDSMREPFADLHANVSAQLALLETCRAVNREAKVVFAGTRQVYGKPRSLPVDESHPTQPTDVNGAHKLAAENLHRVYHHVYGIPLTVLRLSNTYGPRQLMRHNRQGFIGWFVRQAMDGETIRLYGGGRQRRDLNYVDDVVDAFLAVATKAECDGQVYNVGSGEPVTLRCIAELLGELCPGARYRLAPFPPEQKAIDIGDYVADTSKICRDTGWQPRVALRDGLARMIEYYQVHRAEYW